MLLIFPPLTVALREVLAGTRVSDWSALRAVTIRLYYEESLSTIKHSGRKIPTVAGC